MKSLPAGTVTFLFTDIEGSTALLQRLGDHRYAEVLEDHCRLLRDPFEEGNGQEVGRHGDDFLVAFPRRETPWGRPWQRNYALRRSNGERQAFETKEEGHGNR